MEPGCKFCAYIACFYRALDGFKTFIVAAAIMLLGLSEYFSLTDLRPLFEHYLGTDKASLLAIWIPIVFAGLRLITSSKPGGKHDGDEGF